MANLVALLTFCEPGDRVVLESASHVLTSEGMGIREIARLDPRPVDAPDGRPDPRAVEEAIAASGASLLVLENTHTRAGGRISPQRDAVAIAERARARGLAVHLDGARIWNASAATGLTPKELAAPFDTASVCFSKGLGAPVGSALCATREAVERARRLRKMWGGGMRQSGILAAAALHALRNHRERLADDHASAKAFAERAARIDGAHVDLAGVETNIVNIDIAGEDPRLSGEAVALAARGLGLLIGASGPRRIRVVTHLDAPRADVERAADLLAQAIAKVKAG
jgi:threonine aldolase